MRSPILVVSGFVPGYLSITSGNVLERTCLDAVGDMALLVTTGTVLTLSVSASQDGGESVRWAIEVTEALREVCRLRAIANQRAFIEKCAVAA